MTVTVSLELLMTLLLAIGGIAVTWGVMRATVSGYERRLSDLEDRIDDHDETLKAVTRLETELKGVREELHRISQFVDRVRFGAVKA